MGITATQERSARVAALASRGVALPLLLTLLSSCAPQIASVPCNEDEDCGLAAVCLRGSCTGGDPLSQRKDAGPRLDAGDVQPDAGDPPSLDGGQASDDSGRLDEEDADAGVLLEAGPDAGLSLDDAGDAVFDAGPPPVLDAGPPGIVSFHAEPASVSLGSSVTLTWVGNELSACTLEGHAGALEPSGSVVIERPASRPYVLRCSDAAGGEYQAELTVTVDCSQEITLGAVVITSDAELALFPSGACVTVTGDMSVSGLSHVDLTALYGLVAVGGSLSIGGNPALTSLAGLELLRDVGGDLRLGHQELAADPLLALPVLESLHGLSALERVGLDLQILAADSLVTLAGLERLSTVGDDLEVRDSASLKSLRGLERLSSIGSDLDLRNDVALASLGTLPSLTSIGATLRLTDLPALNEIRGLHGIGDDLYAIYLQNCDALASLEGLEGITVLRGYLHVQYNNALLHLDALSALRRAERVVIRRNLNLVSAALPALEIVDYTGGQSCFGDYCDGDLAVDGNDALRELAGFDALTLVRRNLQVLDNAALVEVNGFSSLVRVNNDLIVRDNPALTRVQGFEALANADDIFVERNPRLISVSLPAIDSVDDDVYIVDNDELLNLSGLGSLTSIGGELRITDNAGLTDLGIAPPQVGDYPDCARGCLFYVRANTRLPQAQVVELLAVAGRPVDETDVTIDVSGNAP